jgi:hypothetical protein
MSTRGLTPAPISWNVLLCRMGTICPAPVSGMFATVSAQLVDTTGVPRSTLRRDDEVTIVLARCHPELRLLNVEVAWGLPPLVETRVRHRTVSTK